MKANDISVSIAERTTVALTYSKSFELLVLSSPITHNTLTQDLEYHIARGLELLSELEDVSEIHHAEAFTQLVQLTNNYCVMDSPYFTCWHVAISSELLDALDLLVLLHGDDLLALGLKDTEQKTMLVLAVTASLLVKDDPKAPEEHSVSAVLRQRISSKARRA